MTRYWGSDIGQAIRRWRRTPIVAATISITVAIGVGANVLGFALVRGALYKALPYRDPESLVQLSRKRPGATPQPLTLDEFTTIRERIPAFRAAAACGFAYGTLRGSDDVRNGVINQVTRDFFGVFETAPIVGRALTAEDFQLDARSVVISADVWRSLFGSAPDVLGQTLHVNREPWTIVGVMPETFTPRCAGERDVGAIWVPSQLQHASTSANPAAASVAVFARLAATTSMGDAQREVAGVVPGIDVNGPGKADVAGVRAGLLFLQGVALSVLLIAGANIANLLLIQFGSRRLEIAVRFALGADSSQIIRQLMIESTLIATLGGLGGVAAAYWSANVLSRTAGSMLPPGTTIGVALPELVTGVCLGALLGMACAGVPATLAAHLGWSRAHGSGTVRAGSAASVRKALVAIEVAVAVVVLVGAGLFIRSFVHVIAPEIGFRPQGLVVADLLAPPGLRSRVEYEAFTDSFESAARLRLGQWPMAVASSMPSSATSTATWRLTSPDGVQDGRDYSSAIRAVSSDYFETLDVEILRGSGFGSLGAAQSEPRLAVVSEAFVEQYGRGRDLLGFQVQYGTLLPFRIVGVARNTRSTMFSRESLDLVYVPLRESPSTRLSIAVRAPMTVVARAVRDAARALDPDVVVVRVADLETELGHPTGTRYFYVVMMSLLGTLAMVLAVVGIFGVVSHATALRMREFAIRLALGEQPVRLAHQVVRQGFRPVIAGLCVGMFVAWGLASALKANSTFVAQLYKVEPHDPWTLAFVVSGLVLVAGVACLIPAIRASNADPIRILKVD